jgi:hypothetical protein
MNNEYENTLHAAKRKLVQAFITKEKLICRNDNVCDMGKVFIVNSVLGWCLSRRAKNLISLTDMQYYVSLLQQYIDGKVDLSWHNERLEIHAKE